MREVSNTCKSKLSFTFDDRIFYVAKWAKIDKMGKNGQKLAKMDKNGQNWAKPKMTIFIIQDWLQTSVIFERASATERLCLLLPKSRPHDYVVWWQNEVRNS